MGGAGIDVDFLGSHMKHLIYVCKLESWGVMLLMNRNNDLTTATIILKFQAHLA